MRLPRIPVLACVPVLLGAPVRAADPKADTVCIGRREINAVTPLDERHALARLSAGRFYLLTLERSCREFGQARRVALDRSRSRVCGDGSSLLSYDYPTLGQMRCRIERIERVPDKNAALDLIQSRAER
jgi:hypothetical protein